MLSGIFRWYLYKSGLFLIWLNKTKILGLRPSGMTLFNNCKNAVYKIRVMLRCLCSASSIFPVVYLIKATTTTRKMEDPEQKLFRMTPCLINGKKTNSNKAEIPERCAPPHSSGMTLYFDDNNKEKAFHKTSSSPSVSIGVLNRFCHWSFIQRPWERL